VLPLTNPPAVDNPFRPYDDAHGLAIKFRRQRRVLSGRNWAGGHIGMDMVTQQARPGPHARTRLALRLAGGGLLVATAAIHLDLYLTGYRSIPTIGWLFLLQVIAAFGLGAVVLLSGEWLAAAAGAGFAVATLGGYLLSLWIGLFGFREVRTTAGIVAGVIEVAAFAALAGLATMPAGPGRPGGEQPAARGRLPARLRAGVPGAGPAAAISVAAVSVAALAVLGASVAVTGAPGAAAAGASLKTVRIGGVTVLTDARGLTLYWFAPDTATRSNCNGTCAAYWPPVKGAVTAGPGVTGRLGTIERSDGSIQATYDGHPLYTYVGDTAAGQANGNGLNLNGGLWHEVTAPG
jgi:predicted lipoprotein with Yx(FWY)xxD motif